MVFTPYRVDGRELVDGGLLSPMPMAATRMYSADWVVAVDLNAHLHPVDDGMPRPVVIEEKKPTDGDTPQTDSLRQRIGGFLDDFIEKRSEEHTSELQSLMRISYAVFCLKKKNNTTNTT